MSEEKEVVKVNGKEMTREQFQEMRETLPKDVQLVEVSPEEFKTRIFG
jgi:hypothetical protein